MAFPKKSDPKTSDNRASTIRFGTPEEPKLDLASLQENAIIADVAEVVSEGNPVYEPGPAGTIPSAVPETTTDPAPAPAPEVPLPPEAPAAPATTETSESDEIDDPRFKGKSKVELYKAYQNIERLKGEHDAEVSMYRKLFAERVLKPEMDAAAKSAKPAENPDDPTAALSEILTNPIEREKKVIARAKQELMAELAGVARMNEVQQAFAAKQAIIQSPEFKEWLTSNVPQHVAAVADQDINTFNFIMKSYEMATGATTGSAGTPAPSPSSPAAPAPDRRIPVGPAAGVPAASATPGASKPVIFKQAELAEMMLYRPEEYARRQPEILAAYREGRIK